jgi:hypothetical protein
MFKKEYVHAGKTYRLVPHEEEAIRKIVLCQQRIKAHQLNNNMAGPFEEIAEIWAIQLGISAKEAAELPLRPLIEITKDIERDLEAYKKAFSH